MIKLWPLAFIYAGLLALILSGCSAVAGLGQVPPLDAGACFGGRTTSAIFTGGTGVIAFSAPAGTNVALCAW